MTCGVVTVHDGVVDSVVRRTEQVGVTCIYTHHQPSLIRYSHKRAHSKCIHLQVKEGINYSLSFKIVESFFFRMDKKDSTSDVVYPNVMFCVDNFEDVFSHIYSKEAGEKIAVQLIAANKVSIIMPCHF